jgi:hypothetical protein
MFVLLKVYEACLKIEYKANCFTLIKEKSILGEKENSCLYTNEGDESFE